MPSDRATAFGKAHMKGLFVEINLKSWSEFHATVAGLDLMRNEFENAIHRPLQAPLFRGLGNHEWRLETTLERSPDAPKLPTLIEYYHRAERSKPAVESLTGKSWGKIPFYPAFECLLQSPTFEWADRVLGNNEAIYEYLIYLRHHGFPSPLLDWTASPFVAATFAYDVWDRSASHVGIYAWFRDTMQAHSTDGHLFVVGPYVRTHPRHYAQQSRYSLFLGLETKHYGDQIKYDYRFLPHHNLVDANENKDLVVLIRIPTAEYKMALMDLDTMNLNPYSLYGSEESLIRTIARRELLFK
jgi:hypothetical protein